MQRIMIIGSGGAGKSTFARHLHEATGIKLIHLDKLHWKPNWQGTPDVEWAETVSELSKGDRWIMDGNFGGTMEIRMQAADTVIFLDLPRTLCVYRALKRVVKNYNQTRPDMGEGCTERFDWEFIKWIWGYKNDSGLRVEALIEKYKNQKKIIRLTSKKEVTDFLVSIK